MTAQVASAEKHVTRADIEAKLREIRGEVDTGVESARNVALIVGAVAAVAVVGTVWQFRSRAANRFQAILDAVAERELAQATRGSGSKGR